MLHNRPPQQQECQQVEIKSQRLDGKVVPMLVRDIAALDKVIRRY